MASLLALVLCDADTTVSRHDPRQLVQPLLRNVEMSDDAGNASRIVTHGDPSTGARHQRRDAFQDDPEHSVHVLFVLNTRRRVRERGQLEFTPCQGGFKAADSRSPIAYAF
jgi:hypothetical protein